MKVIQGASSIMISLGVTYGTAFIGLSKARQEMAKAVEEKVKFNVSRTCHTLEDLARMGHPYSVAHYNNPHPATPYWVHLQEEEAAKKGVGTMLSAVYRTEKQVGPNRVESIVGLNTDIAPHAVYVFYGTDRMVGRDFLTPAAEEVKSEFKTKAAEIASTELRLAGTLYTLARISKTVEKFTGGLPVTNFLFRTARYARDLEVLEEFTGAGLSRRLYNRIMAGKIASQFVFRGSGLASQIVNTQMSRLFLRHIFMR